MDIAARAWTNGWNLFSPNHLICWTSFDRAYRPVFWENPINDDLNDLSFLRVWYRMGMIPLEKIPENLRFVLTDLDLYPMEQVRSMDEYWDLIGYDKLTELPKGHRLEALQTETHEKTLRKNGLQKLIKKK